MNTAGETIIEEYLMLVKAKLPNSIAEDVINELRIYMQESATDLGDGQITLDSAKKTVAQFGAPGEVAAEYVQSMLPESIERESVPPEVAKATQQPVREPSHQIEPVLTSITQNDPTMSHFSFFLIITLQSWLWIFIATKLTWLVGPIGIPFWTNIFPILEILIVTGILIFHTLYLQRHNIILWRRAYKEWSAIQNFVTLPENAIPELGVNIRRLDVLLSFVGILLYLSSILIGGNPYYILLCAIPICIALVGRMYYRIAMFDDAKDPIRNSRKQFIINLVLLIILNGTIYWIFNNRFYYSFPVPFLSLLLLSYIICMSPIIVLDIVSGVQNLWWKIHDAESTSVKSSMMSHQEKQALLTQLGKNIKRLYAKITFWIFVFNLPQIYIIFDNPTYDYWSWYNYNSIIFLFIEIMITPAPLAIYYLYRRFAIRRLESNVVFGQRSRLEAVGDLIISTIALIGISISVLPTGLVYSIIEKLVIYEGYISTHWSHILILMQIVAFPLIAVGLFIRIVGDIYEFKAKWKRSAVSLIEESGVFIILALTLFINAGFIEYIALYDWYSGFLNQYALILPLILLIAFQISSSSLKGKLLRRSGQKQENHKTSNVYTSIAN